MSHAPVEDDEILHRSVPAAAVHWVSGGWRLSSEAFNDRRMRPSVDRHHLRPDAVDSKRSENDGVAQLVAGEIRACDKVIHNADAAPGQQITYQLDVCPDPIADDNPEGLAPNPAHAVIASHPAVASGSRFKKVKEALCRLAERRDWVIRPRR